MMKSWNLSLWIAILFLSSCVSSKVHKELQADHDKLAAKNSELLQENHDLKTKVRELEEELKRARQSLDELSGDTVQIAQNLRKLRKKYSDLNESYEFLLANNNELLESSTEENEALLAKLEKLQEDLQVKEDSLKTEKNKLEFLGDQLKAREQRVNELESIISAKDSIMEVIRGRVADALMGFEGKGLTIEQREGKVYVSLESSLLFPSGSWEVDKKGKEALDKLAEVLAENEDLAIMVEGHTDDDPFNSKTSVRDNWDLSVMRATAIVKILTDNKGVDPARITAAGRSEYVPVAPNDSRENKAKNRRTEIILTPDLGELVDLIEEIK